MSLIDLIASPIYCPPRHSSVKKCSIHVFRSHVFKLNFLREPYGCLMATRCVGLAHGYLILLFVVPLLTKADYFFTC